MPQSLAVRYEEQNKDSFVWFRKVNRYYFLPLAAQLLVLRSGEAVLRFTLAQDLDIPPLPDQNRTGH